MEFKDYQTDWLNQFKDVNTPVVGLYGQRNSGRTLFGTGMVLSVLLSTFNSVGVIIAHNNASKKLIKDICLDFFYDAGLKDELIKITEDNIILSNSSKLILLNQNRYISGLCGVRLNVAFMDCDLPFKDDAELRYILTYRLKETGKLIISRDL